MYNINQNLGNNFKSIDNSQFSKLLNNLIVQRIREKGDNQSNGQDDIKLELVKLRSKLYEDKVVFGKKNKDQLIVIEENVRMLKQVIQSDLQNSLECFNQQMQIILDLQTKQENQILNMTTQNIEQFVEQFLQIENQQINYKNLQELLTNNIDEVSKNTLSLNQKLFKLINTDINGYLNQTICSLYQQQLNQDSKNLQLFCKFHEDYQIQMIDLNEVQQSPNRLNCCKCIQLNNIQYTSIQDFQVQWINYQKKKQKCYRHFEENIQTRTKKLENIIFDIQAQITKQIIKIKNEINEAFAHLQTVLLKTQEEIQYENLLFKNYEQILEMADDISNQKSFKQIESNLNIYQINWNLLTSSSQQKLEEILNNSQVILTNNKNEKYSIMQNENNQITSLKIDGFIQPINYQLLQEYSIKQVESCNAIAFNKDCSIVVAAQDKDINIFEFSQGLMKKIQTLSEHRNKIYTLTFMKKSNEFISGSCDVQIRVWTNKQNHLWICQQILDGHCGYITCLILNNNENLIISGSEDKKIKFWIKQIKWECQQTITDHSKDVYGLSLNNQQNQLISCSYDNTILVIGKSWWNKKWSVIQKINVEKYGHRLCFINDNLFTFQPYAQDCMHIYEFNNQNKQFIKKKTFQVKCGTDYNSQLFPQQFIKSKNLLINKIGQFINLIKFKEDEEFLIEQSIDFETNCLFGSISDNGDYLITWDKKSEEIQIRKYTEQ